MITPFMQQYVDVALAHHSPLEYNDTLTVLEFIEVTNYDISKLWVDKFWGSLRYGQLIYVDDELITWIGFNAAQAWRRKNNFMELLKNNKIEYIEYTNDEYSNFLLSLPKESKIYPPASIGKGSNLVKHILIDVEALKDAAMRIGNGKGTHVRTYYRALEKLVGMYMDYQSQFNIAQSNHSRAQLTLKNNEIDAQSKQLVVFQQTLTEKDQILAAKEQELIEKNKRIANTQLVTEGLLSYKLFLERNEKVYVITSRYYASEGLFKVGRTGGISAKDRLSAMNTGHAPNDNLFVATVFNTNNARDLEDRAHKIMRHHRVLTSKEWFHLPYLDICEILTLLNENHNLEQDLLNTITKRLYDISCADPSQIRWTEGVPLMIADSPSQESPSAEPSDSVPLMIADSPSQESPSAEPSDSVQSSAEQTDHISLSTDASQPTRITFTFNIKGWSADQTRDFIVGVLSDYKTQLNNGKPKKPLWSTLTRI